MQENIEKVGLPKWTDDDQTLAQGGAEELKAPETGLATKVAPLRGRRRPPTARGGGGSDDIGDVSWNVPTATLSYPVQHPRPARPQLGERDRDGDADRAQGRRRPAPR